tara:strand:+ start:4334 stop:5371 length:1038 start_codon:yes stop_codon:yes gene_type:complete
MDLKNQIVIITGAAGFIGASLAQKLLRKGMNVIGIDNLNNYYEPKLKKDRIIEIEKTAKKYSSRWKFYEESIENNKNIKEIFRIEQPSLVVNLAAQAGVRYSLTNPYAYSSTNLLGFGNILEISRINKVRHIIYASSSSVYGGNKSLPYKETHQVNHPVSLYAATKKANELMAHTYSYIYNIPCTGLRFFTVYGPWGRPDMAPMIFAKAILLGEKIQVNNYGKMKRDFTYIDDVTEGIYRCCIKPATPNKNFDSFNPDPATSTAPHRIFNIGNNQSINLLEFIQIFEKHLGREASMKMCPLPEGDVIATEADTSALKEWINFQPSTSLDDGLQKFLNWFKNYYQY